MRKICCWAFFFFCTATLFAGGNSSREKAAITHFAPILVELPEDLTPSFLAVPKNLTPDEPYRAFINLLSVVGREKGQEMLSQTAVCWDFDDTLFEIVDREYSLRSPILLFLILHLNRCHVPQSICSRNPRFDRSNRDRFDIAQQKFGNLFQNYFTIAEGEDSKTAIALQAKGERQTVLLVDDSERELKKINDEQIIKIHFPKPQFRSSIDDEDAEAKLTEAKNNYRAQEQEFLKRVESELVF